MKTLSLDLRERIVAAYDAGQGTRREIAERFMVSEAMVKKLLRQRRIHGDLAPRHHRAGRKPKITPEHQRQLAELLERQPDLTLAQMRTALSLDCTLPALHYVLKRMGLTLKKRRSARPSKPAPMCARRASSGTRT
jgi:transposase